MNSRKSTDNITNFVLLPQTKIKHRRYIYIYHSPHSIQTIASISSYLTAQRTLFPQLHTERSPLCSLTSRQYLEKERGKKERKRESLSKPAGSIPLLSPKSSHPFRSSSSSRKIRVIWRSIRVEKFAGEESLPFCPVQASHCSPGARPGRQPPQSGGHLGHPRPKPPPVPSSLCLMQSIRVHLDRGIVKARARYCAPWLPRSRWKIVCCTSTNSVCVRT